MKKAAMIIGGIAFSYKLHEDQVYKHEIHVPRHNLYQSKVTRKPASAKIATTWLFEYSKK